jgi:beta-glucanase (GH16 family)
MRLITRPGARMVWGVSDLAGAAQVTMDVRNTGTQYDCVLTTRASSTSTATTITLGDDPGLSYSVFKFVWAAGNVDFYINDVKVGTHTTNVPTASMYVLYENKVITSPPAEHGDGNSVMYVDYVTATSSAATGEYLLIDNFDALSSYWSKRNNTWDSSFAYTIFKPENVWIDAGKVVLRSNSLLHTGAEIWTSGKFMYGIYKCSAKFNQQPGTWIAPIWSYVWANPVQNEIDIEITKSGATTTAHFKTWHNYSDIEETWVLDFDPNDGYHTYEYRWTATAVTFYIDNVQRGQITKAEADADPGGSAWPNVEMAVYCQNWVQKNLSESVGDGISTLYIDWVSVEPNP